MILDSGIKSRNGEALDTNKNAGVDLLRGTAPAGQSVPVTFSSTTTTTLPDLSGLGGGSSGEAPVDEGIDGRDLLRYMGWFVLAVAGLAALAVLVGCAVATTRALPEGFHDLELYAPTGERVARLARAVEALPR